MTLDEKMKELYKDITKQLEEYQKALDETMSEKIDLENIRKEVREYCLDKAKGRLERTLYDDILEILDKVDKE